MSILCSAALLINQNHAHLNALTGNEDKLVGKELNQKVKMTNNIIWKRNHKCYRIALYLIIMFSSEPHTRPVIPSRCHSDCHHSGSRERVYCLIPVGGAHEHGGSASEHALLLTDRSRAHLLH